MCRLCRGCDIERVVCSEWREEVVALAAAHWSGFDMHRRLRESDRSMAPSSLARCLSLSMLHGRSQTGVSHVAGYRSPMARVEKKIGHVRAGICVVWPRAQRTEQRFKQAAILCRQLPDTTAIEAP
jgi:hypothetical protein